MSAERKLRGWVREIRWGSLAAGLLVLGGLGLGVWRGLGGNLPDLGRLPDIPSESAADRRALRLDVPSVDFGEVSIDESRQRVVQVTNESSAPVTVLKEVTSCGCLRAEMRGARIREGETQELVLTFTGVPGPRSYKTSILLVTDESGPCRYEVEILARVKLEVTASPEAFAFGRLRKGDTRSLVMEIKHVAGQAFAIKEIKTGRPEFSFKWSPLEGGNGYRVQADARVLKPGLVSDRAIVVTEPVYGVNPELLLSLEAVGEVDCLPPVAESRVGSDGRIQPFALVLERASDGPLDVKTVNESRGLKVAFTSEAQTGRTRKLSITLVDGFPAGPPIGEFLVETTAEVDPVTVPYRIEWPGQTKQP